jgi:hypothetical protein
MLKIFIIALCTLSLAGCVFGGGYRDFDRGGGYRGYHDHDWSGDHGWRHDGHDRGHDNGWHRR